GTESMRARPELVSELLEVSGQRLLMMRAHDLVSMGDVLGVDVSRATVEEAEEASQEADDAAVPELTGTRLLYRQFWTLFEPLAKERGWTRASPPAANWWSMSAGGGGNAWSTSWATFGARVELYLGHRDADVNLHRLRLLDQHRDEIQGAFGDVDTVHFDELPHAQACRIEVRNEDGRSIGDQSSWQNTIDWMVDRGERLRAAVDAVGGVPMSLPPTGGVPIVAE
ncbi:MAG: DUF4268 domain-containing protein, partial [Solirubrobacteraceae bacterium]|nr:DUF4268 domain-containing protein [Solirubrobacteraceae bacterium]